MQFRPFVYDATNQQVPVAIKPIEPQDAATTIKEPRQQTDRTSEYISNSKFDIYGLKTWAGELVALDTKTPELARHYERETAKQTMTAKPVRIFLTQRFPLDPHFDPHGETSRRNTWSKEFPISSFLGQKRPQTLMPQRLEGILSLGKDEVGGSNPPSSSKKSCFLSKTGLLLCIFVLWVRA